MRRKMLMSKEGQKGTVEEKDGETWKKEREKRRRATEERKGRRLRGMSGKKEKIELENDT